MEDSENDALLFSVALEEASVRNPLVFTASYDETVGYFKGTGKYSDRAQHPLPALIFLDVHMPKVSGFEVLTWLRKNEASANSTIIMMSGAASEKYVAHAFSLGADHYLRLPRFSGHRHPR
ncbi:MAG: response regulator [Opitutaceae bacterium]